MVAARLAENPEMRILLIEAGQHNKDLENVHMAGGSVVCSRRSFSRNDITDRAQVVE